MLALPDPYDPIANAPYRFHDMSLYAGRYYMYFGPAAALPNVAWRWLTGRRPSAALIQALLAVAMFGCALAILRGVAERTSSSAPGWLPAAIALGVALGGTMPYLIARPGLYSQPVLMAAACCVAGWMLIVRGAGPGARGVLCCLGAGSLFALAVGSRLSTLGYAVAAFAALVWWTRSSGSRARIVRAAAYGLPIVVMAGLLLAYNAARFGDPLEFGQRYQLSTSPEAARRAAEVGLVSAWAVLANAQLYLLAVPTLDVVYPFLAPYASVFLTAADPPLGLVFPPGGWLVAPTLLEAPMVSVFLLAPIGLFAVGAFRGSSDPATRMLMAALAGGLALTFVALVLYPAVQVRYTGDIVPALALLGGIGALRWAERRPIGMMIVAMVVSLAIGATLGLHVWTWSYPDRAAELSAMTRALFNR